MNKSYFCNERVRLRAMEPEDLEVMYAMENDSQTWDVTNFTVPYSRFVLKQYIETHPCAMAALYRCSPPLKRGFREFVLQKGPFLPFVQHPAENGN